MNGEIDPGDEGEIVPTFPRPGLVPAVIEGSYESDPVPKTGETVPAGDSPEEATQSLPEVANAVDAGPGDRGSYEYPTPAVQPVEALGGDEDSTSKSLPTPLFDQDELNNNLGDLIAPKSVSSIPVVVPVIDEIDIAPPHPKLADIPNGRVGEPYEFDIDLEGLTDPELHFKFCPGVQLVGLRLHGTPETAGDYFVRVIGTNAAGLKIEREFRWAVIPDPRSLWKDLPSDPLARYHKPDFATGHLDEARAARFGCDIAAASRRGRSHAHVGSHRDDHFGFECTDDGWIICVVADGAGSAKFSREGSKQATTYLLENLPPALATQFDSEGLRLISEFVNGGAAHGLRSRLYRALVEVTFQSANHLKAFAEAQEIELRDLATTLVLAVARKLDSKWFVASFCIGDGGAAVFKNERLSVDAMSEPDSGDFAGQTRFLMPSEFGDAALSQERIRTWFGENFDGLLLMTDGVSDPMFPLPADWNDPQAWSRLWNGELTAHCDLANQDGSLDMRLLEWLNFYSDGNHDDRTILVLQPRRA